MTHFYVKNSLGTCVNTDGAFASAKTGAFGSGDLTAGNVYATHASAVTNGGAGDADTVYWSDAHDFDAVAAEVVIAGPTGIGEVLKVISVDDANVENYSAGTAPQEYNSSGTAADVTLAGRISLYGVWVTAVDRITLGSDAQVILNDSNVDITATNNGIYGGSSTGLVINGGILDMEVTGGRYFYPWSGSWYRINGMQFTSSAGGDGFVDQLVTSSWSGGGLLEMRGCDLSVIDGVLINFHGGGTSDDAVRVVMDRCLLHADVAFINEDTVNMHGELIATHCAATSAVVDYQYYVKRQNGEAEDDTAFFRDGSTPFTVSNQKVSYKITTTANCSPERPFWMDVPSIPAALGTASSDTLRHHILSSSTLDDKEVWVETIYPDGTNQHVANYTGSSAAVLSGATTRVINPLASATTLTTNTEAWTGRTTENRYQLDSDTSGDVGADSIPITRMYFGIPSATIYVDSAPEVVA